MALNLSSYEFNNHTTLTEHICYSLQKKTYQDISTRTFDLWLQRLA